MKKILICITLILSATLCLLVSNNSRISARAEEVTPREPKFSIDNVTQKDMSDDELSQYKKVEVGDYLFNCTVYIDDSVPYMCSKTNDSCIFNYATMIYFGNLGDENSNTPAMVLNSKSVNRPHENGVPLNCSFEIVGDFGEVSSVSGDIYILNNEGLPSDSDEGDNVDSSVESEENSEKFIDKTTDWLNGTLGLDLTTGTVGGLILVIVVIYLVKKK